MAMGAFIYAWWTGQVTSFGQGLKFVCLSVLAGLGIYLVIALIKAPVVVVGWHLRQISSLSLKLRELDGSLIALQHRTSTINDFRVTKDRPERLEFEFWYFYDGGVGTEDIFIIAKLECNGIEVPSMQDYSDALITGHRALAKMRMVYQTKEGQPTDFPSTHIVLTMEHEPKDVVFFRKSIPYVKSWKSLASQ